MKIGRLQNGQDRKRSGKIRDGEITEPTAGMCGDTHRQTLVILPKKYAEDFKSSRSAIRKPCPILEIMDGSPLVHDMGEGANIVTDIPRYFIYKNGVKVDEVTDASEYWQDDFVGFLIGCSFSFEEALLQAGIDVRHLNGQKCSDVQDEHRMRESRCV